MANARDVKPHSGLSILVFGHTGAGKTTQFLTLPGKKFAYLFDPNALASLAGADIDYEEFLPDKINLDVRSLKKGVGDRVSKVRTSDTYTEWEKHFEQALESGFFDNYDCILFDSLTTFSDMVMDRVLSLNGRFGEWPQQDDYGPQMNAIMKVFRVLTGMNKLVYVTGHVELVKDDLTSRVFYQPIVTGKLKAKLPLLFSQIFFMEAAPKADKGVHYLLQTKPDRLTPLIRCTLKGLEYKEDVTLDFTKPLEKQGLGALLARQQSPLSKKGG